MSKIQYFRDDTHGLGVIKNGEELIYHPKKGQFLPLSEREVIVDASLISATEAKRVRENYDRHYAHLREK